MGESIISGDNEVIFRAECARSTRLKKSDRDFSSSFGRTMNDLSNNKFTSSVSKVLSVEKEEEKEEEEVVEEERALRTRRLRAPAWNNLPRRNRRTAAQTGHGFRVISMAARGRHLKNRHLFLPRRLNNRVVVRTCGATYGPLLMLCKGRIHPLNKVIRKIFGAFGSLTRWCRAAEERKHGARAETTVSVNGYSTSTRTDGGGGGGGGGGEASCTFPDV